MVGLQFYWGASLLFLFCQLLQWPWNDTSHSALLFAAARSSWRAALLLLIQRTCCRLNLVVFSCALCSAERLARCWGSGAGFKFDETKDSIRSMLQVCGAGLRGVSS